MSEEAPVLVAEIALPEHELASAAAMGLSRYLEKNPVSAYCPKCGSALKIASQSAECPECGLPIRLEP